MSEWVQRDATPPRIAEWLHVATGVVLFVAEREQGYGAYIRAPADASIDTVSIGDPQTGEFERFDDRDSAVAATDDWKESAAVLKALEPGDETENGRPDETGDADTEDANEPDDATAGDADTDGASEQTGAAVAGDAGEGNSGGDPGVQGPAGTGPATGGAVGDDGG